MSVTDWIKKLIKLIGKIEESFGQENDEALIQELKEAYDLFEGKEKNYLYSLFIKEFEADSELYLYILSLITYITSDMEAAAMAVDYITSNNLSLKDSLYYELQLRRRRCNYESYRKIHNFNKEKLQDLFLEEPERIKLQDRNEKSIVVITEQILSVNHAPTKNVLDTIYYLHTRFGYKVHLFVCPTKLEKKWDTWYGKLDLNIWKELNGRNGLEYKDITIDTCQIPLKEENFDLIREEIQYIIGLKPHYIYSMGCINAIPDIFTKVTTVVAQSMDTMFPRSDAQILLKTKSDGAELINSSWLKKQKLVYFKNPYFLEESDFIKTRKELCLPENQYLIGIIGNRLDMEVTGDFVKKIRTVIEENREVSFVFIGTFSKCGSYFSDFMEQGRIIYLGYQKDLLSIYPVLNLYWNPPRKGGGISGLMALKSGVPILTLPNCDVSYNVGNEFICREEEELDVIYRYIHDEEFNKIMRKRCIERYQEIEAEQFINLTQTITDIEKAVEEEGIG